MSASPGAPLLEVRDLHVLFDTEDGVVHAVRGMSFAVHRGETVGLVGESGCGKSVSCLSILRLLPPNGRIVGKAVFESTDLLALPRPELDKVRGKDIAMIFQDPVGSLNPVHTVGAQIAESLKLHRGMSQREAEAEALRLLERVSIPEARRRLREYPHQLSGGMNQRAMIAMALACRPKLLIADEPSTALDATIQAQIIELLKDLQAEFSMAVILITHDLGIVAEIAERVTVMYAGTLVEEAGALELFHAPAHPYTLGLLASIPSIDQTRDSLNPIEGSVPSPLHLPPGCAFQPRCRFADEQCRRELPPLAELRGARKVACFHPRAPVT